MSPSLLFFAIDVASIVCTGLLGAWVLVRFPRQRNAQLIALLCVGAICHVILGRVDYGAWTEPAFRIAVGDGRPWLNIGRNLTPGLFMILVHRLFRDRPGPPPWALALLALQLFLEEPAHAFLAPGSRSETLLTEVAPTLLQLLFAGLALYWTLSDWRPDLVETRRRARAVVVALLAVNIVASSLLLRVLIPADSVANYRAHLALGVINLAMAVFLLLRMPGRDLAAYLAPGRSGPAPQPRAGGDKPEETAALVRLTGLLEVERLYRQPGLSLRALADRVGLPEYRLRRLIHERLGHRNFNAFLHNYRIGEASRRLSDPALRRTPILTIALSVGYQSVNTFNRAFRDLMDQTPSAYRAGALDGPATDEDSSPETE